MPGTEDGLYYNYQNTKKSTIQKKKSDVKVDFLFFLLQMVLLF